MTRAWVSILGLGLGLGCNQAPEGLSVTLTPEEAATLDDIAVEFVSAATDKNKKDIINYQYQWMVDGSPTGETDRVLPATRTKKNEVWTVIVTPSDDKEKGDSASAEITIQNTPPEVAPVVEPSAPKTTDNIQIRANDSDADFDRVDVAYAWTRDGTPVNLDGFTLRSDATEKGQVWEVTITPSDDEGPGLSQTLEITIGNTPPVFEKAKIRPTLVNRGDVISCLGEGWFDEDGDLEDYQTTWKVNGAEVSTEPTLELIDFVRNDRVDCTLTAFDGTDVGNSVDAPFIIIQNAAPTVGDVVIGPEDPVHGTRLESDVTGKIDLDGDAYEVNYKWFVDGKLEGRTESLNGDDLRRGQRVQLEVILTDGKSSSEPYLSNILTVANTPPVISDVTIDPTDPATEDELVATVKARDVDRDTITYTYEWYVGGVKSSETSEVLDGITDFDKGDSVYVTVTASDTEDGAPVDSNTVVVVNTPPEAPELVLNPAEPTAEDDLVCEVDNQVADLDDDPITYTFRWLQDGAAYTSADTTTYTGDTIPSGDWSEDETWVCLVTPNDGSDDGPEGRVALGVEDPIGVDFTGATVKKTTPQGGTYSGTSYDDACDDNEVLVGLSGTLTASPYIASGAARCAEMSFSCSGTSCTASTGTITTGTSRGSTSGTSYTSDCPSGSVVTGFVPRGGWYMDQFKLRCAPLTATFDGVDWDIKVGTGTDLSSVGGTGGGVRSRSDCAAGSVASSVQIKASSSLVMTIGFGCQVPSAEMP